jgi:hypothetical protein
MAIIMINSKFFYKTISKTRLTVLNRNANVIIAGKATSNPDLDLILSSFSPANALAGWTDYKDHRKDTFPQIKKLIRECIQTRQCQNGSYYDINGIPFDTVLIYLTDCGWSAYPAWINGNSDYFTEDRKRVSEQYKQRKRK